ncbi:KinB-signaling pathway activation protein [Bacillaceae bacterium S4-13-58]
MTSQKWVRLFFATLFLGGGVTLLTSFFVKSSDYLVAIEDGDYLKLLGTLLYFIFLGLIFSLVSQMGFFAYLTVHQFGLGMFRKLWSPVQILIIAFTLFDLSYFRYNRFANEGDAWSSYVVVPIVLLIFGLLVSYVKTKETNRNAFIPALFFMVTVTSIEWVPAIRTNNSDSMMLMLVTLLTCNTYQLLLLHRINKDKKQ